jgi:hypothetical protein
MGLENSQDVVLLEQLKTILLKQDRQEIDSIKHILNNRSELQKKVDPIFDDKIEELKRRFPEEFGAIINQSIEEKLEESKEQLLNVIYPVLGQMIKKYVSHQFQLLKERIDERVQNTFSSKGLISQVKSKLFGIRAGDMVLSDLDIPLIQEVYVIQRDSGLLIGNYSKNNTMDKDMIAGMLTAIKAFVEDAFQQENQELDLIQYGNYKIRIQNFYQYYIAVALSGSLSAKETDDLNEHITEFANEEMDINFQVITSKLNEKISKQLEITFSKEIFS